ncbi:hypothetical protein E2C01_098750 [Portunus trituberculatus]|uniref:Uncharacterized protein n=1 Tax=Portunus trituberculatus TaxID=210409 RepID=A0A5B7K964_PORTR|nr:hypothetical protein [Portunus trituberculatus]
MATQRGAQDTWGQGRAGRGGCWRLLGHQTHSWGSSVQLYTVDSLRRPPGCIIPL